MTDYAPVRLTEAPSPVDIDQFKSHCRIDSDDENDLIEDVYLPAAVTFVEQRSGVMLGGTFSQQFDGFKRTLRLGVSPVVSITSVKYLDEDGIEQTVTSTNYVLEGASSASPTVRFIDDYDFPNVQDQRPVLTVALAAGFAADAVPATLKAAALLQGGDLYANREANGEALHVNQTAVDLINLHRTKWMA